MEFSRSESGVGSLSLLQGIFPTQGSNPGLHCRRILYQLSHKGSLTLIPLVRLCFSQWNLMSYLEVFLVSETQAYIAFSGIFELHPLENSVKSKGKTDNLTSYTSPL